MIDTVHLVYPHGKAASTPDAIGRHLAAGLSEHYEVVQHEWDDCYRIKPSQNGALVGHAHPMPGTVFRRSLAPGWSRTVLLQPFIPTFTSAGYLVSVLPKCDWALAIAGGYWFESIQGSPFSVWLPKLRRIDLAVDQSEFPPIKTAFNAPGHRRCLYIGHDAWNKNLPYLIDIARRLPEVEFAWIGNGKTAPGPLRRYGYMDLSTPEALALVKESDFLVTVGGQDANPTSLLEAMAWGLVPVCTPQSGYCGVPGIFNVPSDDPDAAACRLRELLALPEHDLELIQSQNWKMLGAHYNWGRFTREVVATIESEPSMTDARREAKLRHRGRGLLNQMASPYMPYRRQGARTIRRRLVAVRGRSGS